MVDSICCSSLGCIKIEQTKKMRKYIIFKFPMALINKLVIHLKAFQYFSLHKMIKLVFG